MEQAIGFGFGLLRWFFFRGRVSSERGRSDCKYECQHEWKSKICHAPEHNRSEPRCKSAEDNRRTRPDLETTFGTAAVRSAPRTKSEPQTQGWQPICPTTTPSAAIGSET